MTNRTLFHRGLLYGLAELRRRFLADGYEFHRAYGEALTGSAIPEAHRVLEYYDPMFGTYYGAEEMILIGMRDLILCLDGSTFKYASFNISKKLATRELDECFKEKAEDYRKLARKFHERLRRKEVA
jgi:hypothetical protein